MADVMWMAYQARRAIPKWLGELTAGDWPTLLATIFAAMAVGATVFTLLRQLRQDRERDVFQRRQQATAVTAWISKDERRSPSGESSFGSGAIVSTLNVLNASGVPVFHATVDLIADNDRCERLWDSDVLPPVEFPIHRNVSAHLAASSNHIIVLRFTDADGVSWFRSSADYLLREGIGSQVK
ncbi:UNVERIFIED_CONTAM: hypothetical protein Q9R71_11865 [Actinomycetes bacterium ARC8]|nr:hypothetical protein [Actinomycetes bacterium ARC8]